MTQTYSPITDTTIEVQLRELHARRHILEKLIRSLEDYGKQATPTLKFSVYAEPRLGRSARRLSS